MREVVARQVAIGFLAAKDDTGQMIAPSIATAYEACHKLL